MNAPARRRRRGLWTTSRLGPDIRMGLENLVAHKLRSLLTMLGMICGVAAVVVTFHPDMSRFVV